MDQDSSHQVPTCPPVLFDEFSLPTYDEWKKEAEAALKGAPFEKRLLTKTYEGITLEPLYTPDHAVSGVDSFPGSLDYLRGASAGGYLAAPWRIAQGCEARLPREANAALLQELARGSQVVHLLLDDATRRGLAPTEGERGMSLVSLEDMDDVLRQVDLRACPLYVDAGASAAPLLGLLAARARAQGEAAALRETEGCVGADPLGTLARYGALSCPVDELYDEMGLVLQWLPLHMPHMKSVLVQASVYHDAGASAVQELGCALAVGAAHIRALLRRGFDIDFIAAQMRFEFSLGANYFMEVAKLRAARPLWARVVEAFGGDEAARRIEVFARTSRFTKTVYDPYVNILRTTTEAFSGVVGGVDGLCVGTFDEPIRPADELSRRIARNIQLLLRHEFDLLQPVDPAGGSWCVERLTRQVADAAWQWFQRIEAEGGMLAALEKGVVQEEIGRVFRERQKNLSLRSDRAVGTNMYANMTERPLPWDAEEAHRLWERRLADAAAYRESMDEAHCRSCLAQLVPAADGAEGAFVEAVAEAFMAGATVAEVRTALDDEAAGGPEVTPLLPHRWAEAYEALRRRTEEHAARTGKNVRVFLANMGPVLQHKARADFSTGFMEVAGFEMLHNNGFATVEEAAEAAVTAKADVAVICSTDDTYPELVPPLARLLKARRPDLCVVLAGAPAPEHKEAYDAAGVDFYIHLRADCRQMLTDIQKMKGIC